MIVRRNGEGSPAETDYEIFTSTTRTMYFTCVTQHQPNLASHAHVKAQALHNEPLTVHRYCLHGDFNDRCPKQGQVF